MAAGMVHSDQKQIKFLAQQNYIQSQSKDTNKHKFASICGGRRNSREWREHVKYAKVKNIRLNCAGRCAAKIF